MYIHTCLYEKLPDLTFLQFLTVCNTPYGPQMNNKDFHINDKNWYKKILEDEINQLTKISKITYEQVRIYIYIQMDKFYVCYTILQLHILLYRLSGILYINYAVLI